MAFKDIPDKPTATAKSSASSASETRNFFDMAQPIVIVHNDTSAAPFTIRLNGNNHSTWSKMMLLHVSSQGKKGYLTGNVAQGILKFFYSMFIHNTIVAFNLSMWTIGESSFPLQVTTTAFPSIQTYHRIGSFTSSNTINPPVEPPQGSQCAPLRLCMFPSHAVLTFTLVVFVFRSYYSRSVEPSTYAAATFDLNWRQAMSSELDALESNNT
ncbi:unnamed protein product [Prunus armeniaca]